MVKRGRANRGPRYFVWSEMTGGQVYQVTSADTPEEAASHGAELLGVTVETLVCVSLGHPFAGMSLGPPARSVAEVYRFKVTRVQVPAYQVEEVK